MLDPELEPVLASALPGERRKLILQFRDERGLEKAMHGAVTRSERLAAMDAHYRALKGPILDTLPGGVEFEDLGASGVVIVSMTVALARALLRPGCPLRESPVVTVRPEKTYAALPALGSQRRAGGD